MWLLLIIIIIIIIKVVIKVTLKVIAGALYIVCGWNAVKVQGWQLMSVNVIEQWITWKNWIKFDVNFGVNFGFNIALNT